MKVMKHMLAAPQHQRLCIAALHENVILDFHHSVDSGIIRSSAVRLVSILYEELSVACKLNSTYSELDLGLWAELSQARSGRPRTSGRSGTTACVWHKCISTTPDRPRSSRLADKRHFGTVVPMTLVSEALVIFTWVRARETHASHGT